MRPLPPVLALLALLITAPAASADVYCVDNPQCPPGGVAYDTPQGALDAANAGTDADSVHMGPGLYTGPFRVDEGTTLAGAGRGATTLTGPADAHILTVGGGRVRDLGLRLGDDATHGMLAGSGTATRVDVDGSALTTAGVGIGVDEFGFALTDSRVVMAHGTGIVGGELVLTDASIDAPTAYRHNDRRASLQRVLITGRTGIENVGGGLDADAVAIIVAGEGARAITAGPGFPFSTSELRHATLLGPAGTGTAVRAIADCDDGSEVSLLDSAIEGFALHVERTSPEGCGDGDPGPTVDVSLSRTAYDPDRVSQAGSGSLTTNQTIAATSLGLDADHVPQPGSPLIDAGDPAEPAGLDVRGLPRPSGAAPDLGAYEYQRDYDPVRRTRPKAVRLRARKIGPRRYRATATVIRKGGRGECTGGVARFKKIPGGARRKRFGAACRAKIVVRARPGTRLRVRFGGTETLKPKRSRTIRLRG